MDITGFLNQTAVYERYIRTDQWGNPIYEPPITIPARVTTKSKLHREDNKTTRIDVGQILTNAVEVRLQDRMNNKELLAVENYVDFTGETIGYTAYPRPPIGYAS